MTDAAHAPAAPPDATPTCDTANSGLGSGSGPGPGPGPAQHDAHTALDDVAVLLPAYNCQGALERTLASFAEPAPVRVLVVDDGSTPPLNAPAQAGLEVEILRLASNGGIERALAAGVNELLRRGVRYIARIDAGDLAAPRRLARQRAYLESHPQVGALGMWAQAVTRQGEPMFVLAPPTEPTQIRRQRFWRSCFVHPAMMLRADAVRTAGNYRVAYRAAEDLDLFLRIMEHAECANLPEIGLRYELDTGGISATRRRAQIVSTLQLQARYAEPGNPYYWLGLAKNLLHLVTPYAWLQHLKRHVLGRTAKPSPARLSSQPATPGQAPAESGAEPLDALPYTDYRDIPQGAPQNAQQGTPPDPLRDGPQDQPQETQPEGRQGVQPDAQPGAPRTKPAAALRVALVCNTAWAIHTYRHGLLRALREQGAQVFVLAPRDRTFALLQAMGCVCIELPMAAKSTNPLHDLHTLLSLYGHYRKLRPDLVFHYTIKANIYGSLAAWLARVKSVAVTTGLGYAFIQDSTAARIAKQLYRLAFRFPQEVWFLNADDRAAFLDQALLAHPQRARLLHGEGIDLAQFAPRPLPQHEGCTFILIARLLWDKGVGEYVEAARRLRERYPQARCQLLGPLGVDNPSAITHAQMRAWQAEGVVEYLGEAIDVRPYIEQADCVVLPSYREGVPRTLLEAAAMGRPIVATRVPGCKEVVEDGATGLLCAARDAAALTEALTRLSDMPVEARHAMGERGRAKMVAEFDERRVIERYFATIAALTGTVLTSPPPQLPFTRETP